MITFTLGFFYLHIVLWVLKEVEIYLKWYNHNLKLFYVIFLKRKLKSLIEIFYHLFF